MGPYKWMLRKGSKKEFCPQCKQKRFVPYVSATDGVTIATDESGAAIYGRCDREQNCGYSLYPSHVKTEGVQYTTPAPPQEPLRFYHAAVRVDTKTPLFDYACKLIGPANAVQVWQRYKVGRDGNRTVFWQIDKNGEIRAGKSIPYKSDGHRDKSDKYPANWLHKCTSWNSYHKGAELQQCYFGEHLLNDYPDATIIIVESEKTALLLSAYCDPARFIWLASGGSQGLKNDTKNKVLKSREVWLIPDNGQFWNWSDTAAKYGWRCFCEIEKYPVFSGCDILDLLEAGAMGADLLWENVKLQRK